MTFPRQRCARRAPCWRGGRGGGGVSKSLKFSNSSSSQPLSDSIYCLLDMTSLPPIRTKTVVVAADVPPQPKRRAKALLQAYYSVQTPDAENSGNPSVALLARRKDPYDIDGLSFDSEKYLTKALQEQPLQALIARDNDLVSGTSPLKNNRRNWTGNLTAFAQISASWTGT